VSHVKRVPRPDMPRHIAALDVCVIPDSNPFGSPVVLFEFMASGKAVVAPSVAPVLDVLEDGRNGLVFKAHDGEALFQSLARAVKDEGLRRRLGEAARADVERKHTWDRNAEATLAAALRVIKEGGNR
jgi:glycosyltransferase involved in cell wall biosynthesis